MKNRFTKITSLILLSTMMLLSSAVGLSSVQAEEPATETFTVIHTNDMHGRLNESPRDSDTYGSETLLSRLKAYVDEHEADLVVDGGDAIQGLPMSNLNDGKYMIEAMIEIGYDAMAVGNHEFDFGYDNLTAIKTVLDSPDNMSLLSSNVEKDGVLPFKPYDIIEKNGKKVAIIGLTTPETEFKTHPNNTEGVKFLDIETQSKKFIDEILEENDDIDLILPLVHLGTDGETKDSERGDLLAVKLADYLKEKGSNIPILFVDGHSHTEHGTDLGKDNLLYVQTGEHLNNIGHVEIDFEDFSKSVTKLVTTQELTGGNPLNAENKAKDAFGELADIDVMDNLPYFFDGERGHVRTRETNLGNLIGDAMVAYGKSLANQPDLAVMNGGGIRVSLEPGRISQADVISVIPFGNTYASIQVSGQQIKDMFEFSYRTPIQDDGEGLLKDDLGYYVQEPNGGFLQVSSNVKIQYNPLLEEGNRIESIMLDRANGWEELTMDGTYTLATNDFLAQGGDGYSMLSGERIEGDSLDDVFGRFLNNELVDWEVYKDAYNPTRIMQVIADEDRVSALDKLVVEANELLADKDKYTEASFEALESALATVTAYLDGPQTNAQHDEMLTLLSGAIDGLEEVEVTPEPKPEEEVPAPDVDHEEGKLPATGMDINSLYYAGLVVLGGISSLGLAKYKKDE